MKSLACNFVWWPKIDAESEVKQCNQCQLSRLSPPDWPEKPWKCVHLDYAGPINGKMFLIVIDAHSKWMEVEIVNSATAQATIECLRMIFARFGLPEVMVTDNGTCFTSSEFQVFEQCNNIRHVCITPYHPSAVQTFKLGISDLVFICEFHRGAAKPTWLPGTVIQKDSGPNCKIKLSDN